MIARHSSLALSAPPEPKGTTADAKADDCYLISSCSVGSGGAHYCSNSAQLATLLREIGAGVKVSPAASSILLRLIEYGDL